MKRAAQILGWVVTAILAAALMGTAWAWAASYQAADSWWLKGRDDVRQDTPGSWTWGLFSNAACVSFEPCLAVQ